MIKCLVFDVGGVVWDYQPFRKELLTQWGELVGLNYDQICLRFLQVYQRFEKDKWDYQFWLAGINPDYSSTEAKITLKKLIETYFQPHLSLEVIELIGQLKNKRLAVGCLSNTENYMKHFWELLFKRINFDFQILSFQVGYRKPEPEIYQEIFKYGQWRPEEVVFIDDTQENIAGARKLGVKVVHYQNFQDLISKLKNHKIYFSDR